MALPIFDFRLAGELSLAATSPSSSVVLEGTIISGNSSTLGSCDNTYWQIEETASGIETQFTFFVSGQSKKVKLKGRWTGSSGENLLVQAWNGSTWDEILSIAESLSDGTYSVNLGSQYTIDNTTRIRVYKATGNNNQLYLDCIQVFSNSLGSNPNPSVIFQAGKGNENDGAIANWGSSIGLFNGSDANNGWAYVVYYLDMLDLSFASGRIRTTIQCVSGSIPIIKIMNSIDVGVPDAGFSPTLSANTSGAGVSAPNSITLLGSNSPVITFQNAYLAIEFGWAGPWSVSFKIQSIEWGEGATPSVWNTIWQYPQ